MGTEMKRVGRKRIGRAVAALAGALAGLGMAGSASAILYTLDAPVFFSGGSNNAEGFLLPVLNSSGTLDLTSGTVNLAGQDFFIFQVSLCDTGDGGGCSGSASGDVDLLFATVTNDSFPLGNPVGTGNIDPGGGTQAPDAVVNNTGSFQGEFEFDLAGNSAANLEAGETSDKLFVTFALGDLSIGSAVNFMIQSGTTFPASGTIVPEPGTVLLLGGGLLGLALAGRRRG